MRNPVQFEPAGSAVDTPVTKLGGQPVWLRTPRWPMSASLGEPMTFIGQFRLDTDNEVRLAYLFMSGCEGSWEPDGGENAVIIQPDGRVPDFIAVEALHEGPALPREDHLPVEQPVDDDEPWEFLGGEPVWLQFDETPGPGWRLIAQLTDRLGHNFGDGGVGYAFISPDGAEGRFLWQCG